MVIGYDGIKVIREKIALAEKREGNASKSKNRSQKSPSALSGNSGLTR